MEISDIYKLLSCPVCKGNLKMNREKTHLLCKRCHQAYPLIEGVPDLTPSHKRELDPELERLREERDKEKYGF